MQTIRVYTRFYDYCLAEDIQHFVSYNAEKLRDQGFQYLIQMARSKSDVFKKPKEEALEAVRRMKAVRKSWEGYAWQEEPESEEDRGCLELLVRAHNEYQRKLEDQEKLLREGTFLDTITAAVARMPTVTRLEIQDRNPMLRKRTPYLFEQTVDDEAVIKATLIPTEWEDARLHDLAQPPVELICQLPLAFHKAGALLTGLEVDVTPPEDCTMLGPNEEDRKSIKALVKTLKEFDFRMLSRKGTSFQSRRERGEIVSLGEFLTAVLDTDSIETMRLDFNFLRDESSPPSFSLYSIIDLRQWPHLEDVRLESLALHLKELERFVDRFGSSLRCLTLHKIYLLSGMWAEGLDMLHRVSIDYINFENPRGLEIEELSAEERE